MGPKKTQKAQSSGKKTAGRIGKTAKTANGSKRSQTSAEPESASTSTTDSGTERLQPEAEKRIPSPSKTASPPESGDSMKMTMCTAPTMVPRTPARRPGRPPSGKKVATARTSPGKLRAAARRSLDPSDNSNDSGLGFDHHFDPYSMGVPERTQCPSDDRGSPAKRCRLDVKYEDEVNDSYSFPEHMMSTEPHATTALIRTAPASSIPSMSINNSQITTSSQAAPRSMPLVSHNASTSPSVTLGTQLSYSSKYGDISLSIICQPEQQHRARYQTEGSRGAVKDRSGNGFPMVKLVGYNKPVTLQVFIGTDAGKVAPHMFYQACRVSGKNSTPCSEKKIEGTIVIELLMDPTKEMTATCDCVGILKERNVDVEHRFPNQQGSRNKKKSTRCRMVFRTTITHDDGMQETLQVSSQQIVCTQPPGIPEICKKSLTSCPATGGLELFVFGKNFTKDAKVYFQLKENNQIRWEKVVTPDKEYLIQAHFTCIVPPYMHPNITEPVTVRLFVVSSGKTSEPQQFVYTPVIGAIPSVCVDAPQATTSSAPFLPKMIWPSLSKQEQDVDMMPPPGTSMVPLSQRRPSTNMNQNSDSNSPPLRNLKQELLDDSTQSSILDPSELRANRYRHISESSLDVHPGESNLSMMNDNSMDMLRHNINENSNISLSNENSVEMMVRRNSMSRPNNICESSNVSLVNENSVEMMVRRNSLSRPNNMCENSNVSVGNENSVEMMVRRNSLSRPNNMCENSNVSVGNENSVEMMVRRNSLSRPNNMCENSNVSIGNENSVEMMVRRNSMSRPGNICESSLDVNVSNSNMSSLNDESNCGAVLQQFNHTGLLTTVQSNISNASVDDLKVMDLRKLPMATVADLVNTTAPSMATLHSFGVTETSGHPLPTQSAHSIESYLTNIENKNGMFDRRLGANPPTHLMPMEPSYMQTQRPMVTMHQSNILSMVAKSEAAAIAEQMVADQTAITTTVTSIPTTMEHPMLTSSITTEKLDALVNCALESHINNSRNNGTKLTTSLGNRDVLMNGQNSLMVPPMITTALTSPTLQQNQSANISPEVILNTQISPSLMCRSTAGMMQDTLLAGSNLNTICHTQATENSIMPQQNMNMLSPVQAISPNGQLSPNGQQIIRPAQTEKDIILNAAHELLAIQKKIVFGNDMHMMMQENLGGENINVQNGTMLDGNIRSEGGFVSNQYRNVATTQAENMPANSEQQRNAERMIPASFPSMSDSDLINIINPTCFDEGNNFQ